MKNKQNTEASGSATSYRTRLDSLADASLRQS